MHIEAVLDNVRRELTRACTKHPLWPTDPIHAAAIVVEEAGELQRAALQVTYETGSLESLQKEAIQTAAMAIRFLWMLDSCEPQQSGQVDRNGWLQIDRIAAREGSEKTER